MKKIALLVAFVTLGLMTAASASPMAVSVDPVVATSPAEPAVDLAVLSGRWKLFFGNRICWGQVVNLPGESQCV